MTQLIARQIKTYTILRIIGEGYWAKVYQAVNTVDGKQVAIKAISRAITAKFPKLNELIANEVKILRKCKNANVISYIDSLSTSEYFFIVTEYCNGGDLAHYLDTKKRLTEEEATIFLKQIINGFKGLHEVNAMHRDFKAANILLHDGACKIADLGFGKQFQKDQVTRTKLGTSITMAPQLHESSSYGFAADIWSVGVVYYQLIYGNYPFIGFTNNELFNNIKNTRPDFSFVNISQVARDFIEKCLVVDVKKRISWRDLYCHPLITDLCPAVMIYNSKFEQDISSNRKFYQQEPIQAQKKSESDQGVILGETNARESIPTKEEVQKLKQANEMKQTMALCFDKYTRGYLNRRNSIMFLFKFVYPHIGQFYKIEGDHQMFVMVTAKKAFHEMRDFYLALVFKVNFLRVELFFKQFSESQFYISITSILRRNLEEIEIKFAYVRGYMQFHSQKIGKEMDIEVIASQNWRQFVDDQIDKYRLLLAQRIDSVSNQLRPSLLSVIYALDFYRNNQSASIEEFHCNIQTLSLKSLQKNTRQQLKMTPK